MENSNNYIHSIHYKLNILKNKRPTTKEILNFRQRNLKKNNYQVNKNYLKIYKFLRTEIRKWQTDLDKLENWQTKYSENWEEEINYNLNQLLFLNDQMRMMPITIINNLTLKKYQTYNQLIYNKHGDNFKLLMGLTSKMDLSY